MPEPAGTVAAESGPGARLLVDLDAITANWRALAARAAPASCGAAVKANAYGLGAGPVGRALHAAGVRQFYVATPEEGVALRAALPPAAAEDPVRIVILNGPRLAPAEIYVAHGLIPALNDVGDVALWREAAARLSRRLPCAIQFDTGMTRLGIDLKSVPLLLDTKVLSSLEVVLYLSHLACADEPGHPLNEAQRRRFAALLAGLPPAPASLANSAGIFLGPAFHFDAVRPGAALYGIAPMAGRPNPMAPVVTLEAPILQLRTVEPPAVVGYGASRAVMRPMRLATIGIGYADGLIRALGNRGVVSIGGTKAPIFGRVSMDLATVDVSHLPESTVHPGTLVRILGSDLPVDDVAAAAGTIGYEVLTGLGSRIRRHYRGGVEGEGAR